MTTPPDATPTTVTDARKPLLPRWPPLSPKVVLGVALILGFVVLNIMGITREPAPAATPDYRASALAGFGAASAADLRSDRAELTRRFDRATVEGQPPAVLPPTPVDLDDLPRPQTHFGPSTPGVASSARPADGRRASSIVSSRRPAGRRADAPAGVPAGRSEGDPASALERFKPPSVDEIMRAAARVSGKGVAPPAAGSAPIAPPAAATEASGAHGVLRRASHAGNTHRVTEGTTIAGVLKHRLGGNMGDSPVNVEVNEHVYAKDLTLVVPMGSELIGRAKAVGGAADARLAVSFHRLILPNGDDVSLNQFMGAQQSGDVGLADQINRHYLATFGAAAAVGLIQGLSQLATTGFGGDRNNTTVVFGGLGGNTSQAATMTLSGFLNRLPTITIREGHRVRVWVTSNLELPAWVP